MAWRGTVRRGKDLGLELKKRGGMIKMEIIGSKGGGKPP
jgi:hypothetical protein